MEFQFSSVGPLSAIWKAPIDLTFFDGHFPGNPVLPGAIALEVSLSFLVHVTGEKLSPPFQVFNAKFSRAILPGTPIRLEAKEQLGGWEVRWIEVESGVELAVLGLTGS